MSQPVPAGYTVFPWASLPASFTLTALSGKWWGYSGTTLYLDTTTPILNMFVDQPSDVFGGTGATGWMRIQRVGTSGGAESARHAGFDMFLSAWGGNNFDFAFRFYYVTGGNFAQVIIGNNYPNNSVGYYVQDSGNGRVRINTTTASTATVFTISNLINGYGLYDGTYLTAAPFITSTDSAWHSVLVTRTATPGKTMAHIGHPDVSVGLANRSFYGYMSEVILYAPVLAAQSSTVPDYNIFYKNAHVPFWQNGLIASYTPENWTGSSWLNGNFGTLPVTTLTGTTSLASATSYQNIFTNLSGGAQTSARAIFSYRRVNMNYVGPTFRLRRSSDNVLLIFYADGAGNLGTGVGASGTPLLEWLGGATAYVDTWYDQSNGVRHATQTTWTLQPTLSLAKLAVDFTTNGTMFNLPTGTVPMNIPYTFVARHGYMSASVSGGIIGAGGTNTNNQTNNFMGNPSVGYYNYWFNNDANANLGGPPVKESVVSVRYDGPTTAGTTYFFVNGAQTNAVARSGWNGVAGGEMIGKTTNDSTLNGLLYDCFIFASALSDADRTSIENVLMNSSSALPTLYGPSSATMTWPSGVLPSTYSIFHLAKYQKPSRGTYGRILQSSTTNWLSGFYYNGTIPVSGVAYHNGFLTQSVASAHGTGWVLSTDQNSLYRSLGRTRGTTGAGTPSFGTLAINTGFDVSDFTFQALMVYNRTLNATEYQMVEDYLANRFKIPVPPQEGLALSLDASDYFTTDTTTWTDRSPNGRNFTLATAGAYTSTGAFPYMALSTSRATIATAVPAATYNTLIVFGTIKNSTGNWRGLIARDGSLMQVIIESGTNRLGMFNGSFIPCDQNVDVTTLDQVYTRFNMHVWKLSSVSPYYQYYFNPSVAPCSPTGIITDSRASYTSGFAFLSDSDAGSARYWGDMGTVLYYNRDLSDQELAETYQRHMTKYLLPTPFIPLTPKPTGYVFTRSGMYTPGTGVTYVKVLVIAGAGGGGGGFEGGGGGAGGLVYSSFYYVTAGTPIQVIIGQGGRGARRNSLPGNGENTIFGTLTAYGGGAGGSDQTTGSIGPAAVDGRSGGSGGGGTWGSTGSSVLNPGAGYPGQGFTGGLGFRNPFVGGGGGGAVSRGFDGASYIAGDGGTGATYNLLGVTKSYCGGGGGSLRGSGTSSGGLGGGGGGNGTGRGADATYYGSGGGAGGGNGTVCHGGDGFQGIVILEVNTDPFPTPILQNPGNQAFVAGGNFIINQLSQGIPELRWTIGRFYNQPVLTTPTNQSYGATGGTFTVTQTVNSFLVGPLVWTISPSTGITLQSSSSSSATFYVNGLLAAVPTTVTVTGLDGKTATTGTFTITCTGYRGSSASQPAANALETLADYPGAPDGLYWITCAGVATQIYCVMNSLYNGGGWMLLMKATRGTTFNFNSTYFTNNTTTLNPTDLSLTNDADAKYASFNSVSVKDVMAWWPDVGYTGGTIPSTPYWTWHINNWYSANFPSMTGNSTVLSGQTYIASASSELGGGYEAYRAFDFNTTTLWHTATSAYTSGAYSAGTYSTTISGVARGGEWIQLQYPSAVTITSYEIQSRDGQLPGAPITWWLAGSNDGSTWTTVDNRSSITWETNLQTNSFIATAPGTYSYYRLVITNNNGLGYISMPTFTIRTTSTNSRITAYDGMSTGNSRNAPGYSNPNTWDGNSTNIWSRQGGAWRHVIGGGSHVGANQPVRWGFLYNNEAEFGSIDVTGGIGMNLNNHSAGDTIGCCQTSTGLNRTMRVLFFGR